MNWRDSTDKDKVKEQIPILYKKGLNIKKISDKLNLHEQTVSKVLNELSINDLSKNAYKKHKEIITYSDKIIELLNCGVSINELSKIFGRNDKQYFFKLRKTCQQ